MVDKVLPLLAATLCLGITAPHARATIHLENYQLASSFDLPTTEAAETSAITVDWTTGHLYVVSDQGNFIVELNRAGEVLSTMTLKGFSDTEGLAYIGHGRFLIAEERIQTAFLFSYTAGATIHRKDLQSFVFGTEAGNSGLEGITYDPVTELVFGVKEKNPELFYQAEIDFQTGAISVTNPFDPSSLNLADIADIFALGNVATFVGSTDAGNLLLLSQQSNRLIEITRSGQLLSSLDLSFLGVNDIEGVAMDAQGFLYLTSESPKVFVLAAVPEPGTLAILTLTGAFGAIAGRRRSTPP